MPIVDLISPDAIMPSLRVSSKKALLHDMSERSASLSGLPAREIFDSVVQRERLGSTGVGNGIAIPHGKLEKCDRIFGVFARLEKPIEFEAMDGAPVDLVFLLIASEHAGADHLKALARVARFLRNPKLAMQLRGAREADSIFAVMRQSDPASHAA